VTPLDVHERSELLVGAMTLRIDRQGSQRWLSIGVPGEGDSIYPEVELNDEQREWLRKELEK
jgi:hypothetical protein